MKFLFLILFEIAFLHCAFSQNSENTWSNLAQLEFNSSMNTAVIGSYADPVLKITYALFDASPIGSGNSSLMVAQIYDNDTVGDLLDLNITSNYINYGDIKGMQHEETHKLFVAYTESRNNWNGTCDLNNTSACQEIFFIESQDAGLEWSQPIKIYHENMSDPLQRIAPKIVYTIENDSTYIFYAVVFPDSTVKLAFASRSYNSTDFSYEKFLFEDRNNSINTWFSVAPTVINGTLVLNLVWVENDSHVMYSNSVDLINWSNPIELGQTTNYSIYKNSPVMIIRANIPNSGCLYFLYVAPDLKGYIRQSCDQGFTWSDPVQITQNDTEIVRSAHCRESGAEKVFIVAKAIGGIPFTIYDPMTRNATFMTNAVVGWDMPPFEIQDPFLVCYDDINNQEYVVKVAATTNEGDFVNIQNGRFTSTRIKYYK